MYLPPTFFIIGERKCGTSSLYRYLLQHPNVLPCALKEPNFFGRGTAYVQQHIADYWKLFPSKENTENCSFSWPELNQEGILYEENVTIFRQPNQKYITGEASANTYYEVAPTLVQQYLPTVKLILLFRHPVERAFSHYRMYQRFQEEGRELGFKVRDFETEVLEEIDLIQQGKQGEYLSPSRYIHSLQKWVDTFGRDAMRIYFTEDLKEMEGAIKILQDLQHFLELPIYQYSNFLPKHFNKAPKATIPTPLFQHLTQFFKADNEALFNFLKLPNRW